MELLRQENELLRETINSADKDIEEIEAQLQVTGPVYHLQTKGNAQDRIDMHWYGLAASSSCSKDYGHKDTLAGCHAAGGGRRCD